MSKRWHCDACLSELSYNEQWDAEYCKQCNQWKSPKCGVTSNEFTIECYFECWKRPERPNDKEET